jgi:phenylalanyl-tRNA synthetase beta chain
MTFELGRVYLPERGDGLLPEEEQRLSILLTGPRRPVSFHPDPAGAENADFFDLKGIVETLLDRLGIAADEIEFVARPNSLPFGPQSAELLIRGERVGMLGRLHTEVQRAYDLPDTPIYLAELRVAPLMKPSWVVETMRPISAYPPVVEDLAFVVAEPVSAAQVVRAIRQAGGDLLTEIELFDVYRGQPIPAGQKSLAYKLTYQSLEKSLTDEDVAALRSRIVQQVAESVSGTLRAG